MRHWPTGRGRGEGLGVWKCYSATTRIEPSDFARSRCYKDATAVLRGATKERPKYILSPSRMVMTCRGRRSRWVIAVAATTSGRMQKGGLNAEPHRTHYGLTLWFDPWF